MAGIRSKTGPWLMSSSLTEVDPTTDNYLVCTFPKSKTSMSKLTGHFWRQSELAILNYSMFAGFQITWKKTLELVGILSKQKNIIWICPSIILNSILGPSNWFLKGVTATRCLRVCNSWCLLAEGVFKIICILEYAKSNLCINSS